MSMPNFLIIGAAKSGTTALYNYLNQHPDIYMSPIKEPHFFSYRNRDTETHGPGDNMASAITEIEAYQNLFAGATTQTAVGEASTTYLYLEDSAAEIEKLVPEAKLIAILRDPAERAYSAYYHLVRQGRETAVDFQQALELELDRIHQGWGPLWHYVHGGYYYQQLRRYYDRFDETRIRVYLYDDFTTSPVGVLQDIFRFLRVDDRFVPEMTVRYNVTGSPRNRWVHALFINDFLLKRAIKLLVPGKLRRRLRLSVMERNLVKPPIKPSVRKQLIDKFREDILSLQDLIDRDLSGWMR